MRQAFCCIGFAAENMIARDWRPHGQVAPAAPEDCAAYSCATTAVPSCASTSPAESPCLTPCETPLVERRACLHISAAVNMTRNGGAASSSQPKKVMVPKKKPKTILSPHGAPSGRMLAMPAKKVTPQSSYVPAEKRSRSASPQKQPETDAPDVPVVLSDVLVGRVPKWLLPPERKTKSAKSSPRKSKGGPSSPSRRQVQNLSATMPLPPRGTLAGSNREDTCSEPGDSPSRSLRCDSNDVSHVADAALSKSEELIRNLRLATDYGFGDTIESIGNAEQDVTNVALEGGALSERQFSENSYSGLDTSEPSEAPESPFSYVACGTGCATPTSGADCAERLKDYEYEKRIAELEEHLKNTSFDPAQVSWDQDHAAQLFADRHLIEAKLLDGNAQVYANSTASTSGRGSPGSSCCGRSLLSSSSRATENEAALRELRQAMRQRWPGEAEPLEYAISKKKEVVILQDPPRIDGMASAVSIGASSSISQVPSQVVTPSSVCRALLPGATLTPVAVPVAAPGCSLRVRSPAGAAARSPRGNGHKLVKHSVQVTHTYNFITVQN